MRQRQRTIVWRRLDSIAAEYFSLWRNTDAWELEGIVVAVLEKMPLHVTFRVECDRLWQTRAVYVKLESSMRPRELHIYVDEQSRWWLDESELVAVRGCVDVDLGITPATNTLPIRRLKLAVGDTHEILAAWIRFPELAIQRLEQRYTHLDEFRYQYASANFVTEIEVDELGLARRYAGVWESAARISK